MSSAGIEPVNSGPLIIRTYNDDSSNNTYVLSTFDNPVPSNLILTTSSFGQIKPSDNIYLSSLNTSSLIANYFTTNSTAIISTLRPSTIIDSVGSGGSAGQILTAGNGNSLLWESQTPSLFTINDITRTVNGYNSVSITLSTFISQKPYYFNSPVLITGGNENTPGFIITKIIDIPTNNIFSALYRNLGGYQINLGPPPTSSIQTLSNTIFFPTSSIINFEVANLTPSTITFQFFTPQFSRLY